MPILPANNTAWPPLEHADRYRRMRRYAAWYSGAHEDLVAEYGARPISVPANEGGVIKRAIGALRNEFWAEASEEQEDTKRHLPTAGDIATISSELLFADPPRFEVQGPRYETDGPAGADGRPTYRAGDPMPETAAAQARLDEIVDKGGLIATLLAAAETSSALGAVALRIAFDKTRGHQFPRVTRVDADAMIPSYSWGDLQGVVFWREIRRANGEVWRHLEGHEGGKVYHALYKGTGTELGLAVPMTEGDATCQALAPNLDSEQAITMQLGATTAVSVPNMLPDPQDRRGNAGRSDYTPAALDLLEDGDRLYTRMMESVDDARSRLIIASYLLSRDGFGRGVTFDPNQRIFTKINQAPAERESGELPIEKVQFDMKIAEFLEGIEALVLKAIKAAGYNPQTMGTDGDVAMTATEYAGRNKRSMATRDKKIRYWRPALEALLTSLVAIDVQEFHPPGVQAYPVRVEFPEAVQPTLRELAETAKTLKDADASSRFERVSTVHPEWSDPQVQAEVDRMAAEGEIDPGTIGLGGEGL